MITFTSHFFICNILLSGFIAAMLFIKYIFKKHLTERMKYNFWFLLFVLLLIPFLPIQPASIFAVPSLKLTSPLSATGTSDTTGLARNQINDFAVSISNYTPAFTFQLLFILWICGIIVMTLFLLYSRKKLSQIEISALPLQNETIRTVYAKCLAELNCKKQIPIYSTAFLKSPVAVGFLRPRIYLPISLLSDFDTHEIRYMLLHELQHIRHKDALSNQLMNLSLVVYWFHPLVWYAIKQMRDDREIACDSSVLQMLPSSDYKDYGNTLLNFAEKISHSPFSFFTGIGSKANQTKSRILHIASFKEATSCTKIKGGVICSLCALVLLFFAPYLSTYANSSDIYHFDTADKHITNVDLSSAFEGYEGSFVMYTEDTDAFQIYNMEAALTRTSPVSTWKIYDALAALEYGVITPTESSIPWNGQSYPFTVWETNQNLTSAMQNSVNWYFQTLDKSLGRSNVQKFIRQISYGNQNISNNLDLYWGDSSLKISPLEQVELLWKLNHNTFDFSPENITAVKKSICLLSTPELSVYGKTGTGRTGETNTSGWFIGYIENDGHTSYFATHIEGKQNVSGTKAKEITETILTEIGTF